MTKAGERQYSEKPGFGFPTGPDPETLAYLKAKGWAPAFSYKDVWGEEHAFAFTVAKATQMEVLRAIRIELERAQRQGLPFDAFRRTLTPTLQRLGWWGDGEVPDPRTGFKRPGRLGSPRRLRTIYEANIRTAHAAGQWQRIERTKAALPYLLYELGPSERHRPEHAKKRGLLLPVDDPFWRQWMPPNGWGCKCRVRQVSKAEARRQGWSVSPSPKIETRPWTNDRRGAQGAPSSTSAGGAGGAQGAPSSTSAGGAGGETIDVPVGIDPGWDTNPGLTGRRNLDRWAVDKLRDAPPELARAAIADMVASRRFADWLAHPVGWFPVTRLDDKVAAAIGAKNPVAVLSEDTMTKQRGERPGNPGHPELTLEEYRALPYLGADPELVIQDGAQTLVVIRRDGGLYLVAVKATKTGEATFVSSFRHTTQRDIDRKRESGTVLYER